MENQQFIFQTRSVWFDVINRNICIFKKQKNNFSKVQSYCRIYLFWMSVLRGSYVATRVNLVSTTFKAADKQAAEPVCWSCWLVGGAGQIHKQLCVP